jgi:hypothetical protein
VDELLKSQYLNENSALACSPWIDETVGFNTSAVLTLSLTECLSVVILSVVLYAISRAVSLWGCNCKLGVNLVMEKTVMFDDARTKNILRPTYSGNVFSR